MIIICLCSELNTLENFISSCSGNLGNAYEITQQFSQLNSPCLCEVFLQTHENEFSVSVLSVLKYLVYLNLK
jgi:hypothetical protein